jgi:hypothetical protein
MDRLNVLRDEYPGDDAWRRFVDVFRPAWVERPDKGKVVSAIGDEEFAIVLVDSMGDRAIEWFSTPIGALDKRTPSDVLSNEPSGRTIIRTLLMRMPR